jgi:hypothetical protein
MDSVAELAHITDAWRSLFFTGITPAHYPAFNRMPIYANSWRRQCLLLIDNCEHVTSELEPLITLLLRLAPGSNCY